MVEIHDLIINEVFKRSAEHELVISPANCVWCSERVEFLGYVKTAGGTEMAEDKIECI
jgi:hypothetical protein